MANINEMTRNKQMALLVTLLLGLAGAGIVAWYIGSPSRSALGKNQPAKPVPDMTGAVTSTTFGKKVSESAVADLQHTASEVDKKLNQFELQLTKITGENEVYRKTVQMQNDVLKHLQTQMDSLRSEHHADTLKLRGDRAEPQLPVGTSLPASVPPPTAFYPGPPMNQTVISDRAQHPSELSTMTVAYSRNNDKRHSLPYIPSGSFAPATVIEGADANASVTGENVRQPSLMKPGNCSQVRAVLSATLLKTATERPENTAAPISLSLRELKILMATKPVSQPERPGRIHLSRSCCVRTLRRFANITRQMKGSSALLNRASLKVSRLPKMPTSVPLCCVSPVRFLITVCFSTRSVG